MHTSFFPLSRDNPVAAKLLIEAGADVNVKEFRGVTPIMMAAALGHAETLEAILASPVANVNVQVSIVGAMLCLVFTGCPVSSFRGFAVLTMKYDSWSQNKVPVYSPEFA